MRLTRLLPSDEPALRRWAHAFLMEHLRWWSEAAGLGWTETELAGHIVAFDMVERDVSRLYKAARAFQTNLVAVARQDETPLGAVWAESRRDPFLAVELGVLAWIYVEPSARRQGVGEALVREALDWIGARGLSVAQVHVVGANESAVRLYQRAGLAIVDHRLLGRFGEASDD